MNHIQFDHPLLGIIIRGILIIRYMKLMPGSIRFHLILLTQPVDDTDSLRLIAYRDPFYFGCHIANPVDLLPVGLVVLHLAAQGIENEVKQIPDPYQPILSASQSQPIPGASQSQPIPDASRTHPTLGASLTPVHCLHAADTHPTLGAPSN